MESSDITYSQRVERLVLSVIDIDIPAVADIEYETQLKLKKLLVADKPDSFVLADNIESGAGNKIPLWLTGFLY